jgi:hypothetical protein
MFNPPVEDAADGEADKCLRLPCLPRSKSGIFDLILKKISLWMDTIQTALQSL